MPNRTEVIERLRADAEGARGVADENPDVLATAANLEAAAELLEADTAQRSLRKALAQRDKEWREALLGDEAVRAVAAQPFTNAGGDGSGYLAAIDPAEREYLLAEARSMLQAAIDKAAPNGGEE